MIALDTNILLRYLVEPNSPEGLIATKLIEETLSLINPGYISVLVLAEMLWVLRKGYSVSSENQRMIVSKILKMSQLMVEQGALVEGALDLPHPGLADCILHEIGQAAGCSYTATFDNRFARMNHVKLLI